MKGLLWGCELFAGGQLGELRKRFAGCSASDDAAFRAMGAVADEITGSPVHKDARAGELLYAGWFAALATNAMEFPTQLQTMVLVDIVEEVVRGLLQKLGTGPAMGVLMRAALNLTRERMCKP